MKPLAIICVLALAACEKRAEPLPVLGTVPHFELTASDGMPFSSENLGGKVWVADFIFTTCPGPCPRMSAKMKQVAKAIESMNSVEIVSFTVDPEHDTPAVLADYAKRYGADTKRWHFLTGPMASLDSLSWSAFHLNHTDGKLEHSTRFAIVDKSGQIRHYVGTEEGDPVAEVLATIRRLGMQG